MSVAAFVAHAGDPLTKRELALAYWTISGALFLTGPGRLRLGLVSPRPKGGKSNL